MYPFQEKELEFTSRRSLQEAIMGLPAGSLQVCVKAVAAGLSRYQPWEITKLSTAKKQAMLGAASIYKRGIEVLDGPLKIFPPQRDEVSVCESIDLPSLQLSMGNSFRVIDAHVEQLFPQFISDESHSFSAFEATKNLQTVVEIIQSWEAAGRPSRWWAVGGGCTLDVAGFAASLTGSTLNLVPTTLLSIVDATYGGKTAVNWYSPSGKGGKNLLGRFHTPEKIYLCSKFLTTLPQHEWRSGVGECLKHQLLLQGLLGWKTFHVTSPQDSWQSILKLAQVKNQIIGSDITEKGQRVVLNLGHTLGHALESCAHSNPQRRLLSHGECVLLGLLYSYCVSRQKEMLSPCDVNNFAEGLRCLQLLPTPKRLESHLGKSLQDSQTWKLLFASMQQDKKNTEAHIEMVLLTENRSPLEKPWKFPVGAEDLENSWINFRKIIQKIGGGYDD